MWGDDDYGYAAALPEIKAALEAAGATAEWAAQYQQRPRPPEGTLFKIGQIGTLPAAPAGGDVVRGWDLAATRAMGGRDPDWTAGVKLAHLPDGRWIVLDVARARGGPEEVEALIVNTATQDGAQVRISLPQDPGQAGKMQAQYYVRRLAGYRVETSPETGDKADRAGPVAAQCNVGNLSLVAAPWNRAFLDELAAFSNGAHDDQVDALSRAFSVLVKPMSNAGLLEYARQRAAEIAAARRGFAQ